MPRTLEVQVSEEQLKKLREEIRAQMEDDFNYEKLMEHLKGTHSVSIHEYLRAYGIFDRVDKLKETKVKDLSRHEKLLLANYWLICGINDR